MLLLTANIILLGSVRKNEKQSTKYAKILLVRHGRQRQITPMILFSSCIILLTISPRYLLQFYFNFFQQSFNCSLIHFAPHVLKTLELFNYSFNVFVSVVSGKNARRELFNMLSCRSTSLNSKYNGSSEHYSVVLSKMTYQNRSKHNTNNQMNSTNTALLTNNTDFH
ncbi:unnamed protein product [Rotaria socialis]|nr:unnamed protein product [Rotaria socialis]CAF4732580.1 unnamed protein product [Rotaria socialis]